MCVMGLGLIDIISGQDERRGLVAKALMDLLAQQLPRPTRTHADKVSAAIVTGVSPDLEANDKALSDAVVKVILPAEYKYSSWIGGSVLSGLSMTQMAWLRTSGEELAPSLRPFFGRCDGPNSYWRCMCGQYNPLLANELGVETRKKDAEAINDELQALHDQTIGCILPIEELPVWKHALRKKVDLEQEMNEAALEAQRGTLHFSEFTLNRYNFQL